ncbi:MAG: CRTAC1 family protein [Gammaproteobacteria bacterium]|nr:CRTAC1 family protein [Gammaproteobacteria bacterium]
MSNCNVSFRSAMLMLVCLPSLLSCTVDSKTSSTQSVSWFEDRQQVLGLNFRHNSGHRKVPLLPEINGSGAAVVDFNGDGWLDIYFVQSGSLYSEEAEEWRNQVFLNDGDGSFTNVTNSAGVAGDTGYGMGVAAGDYDNDGDVDLYVTNVGTNVLLENDGTGKFVDVAARAGVDDSGFGASASFQDFDRDGYLDLFVSNYVNWHRNSEFECYEQGIRAYCPPVRYRAPASNRLYRNNQDGTFSDISDVSGIAVEFGHSFGVVTADFNTDELVDIFVANDRTPNELWINQGNMRFANLADEFGAAADGYGKVKAGMGVDVADFDHDGDSDLLVVNLIGETDTFFRNQNNHFVDVTSWMGTNSESSRFTRWGAVLEDFNNDGRTDLYVANGGVYPVDLNLSDIYAEPNLLYSGTESGAFRLVGSSDSTDNQSKHTSRGVAVGDLNRDGGLDLVVVNRDSEPYLLMNQVQNRGNWISLELRESNGRIALGASITYTVNSLDRYGFVSRDGSFMSSSDPRVHVGLGEIESIVDVRVTWPDGQQERFGELAGNQFVILRQGEGLDSNDSDGN